MKRIVLMLVAVLFAVPALNAQNHGEAGVFLDYVRLHHADQNFFGLGGRAGFNVHSNVQFEAEMSYDFERTLSSSVTSTGGTLVTSSVGLHMIHGLFGPKIQTGGQAFRAFVTAKGGFLNFGVGSRVNAGSFNSQLATFSQGDTNGVFYPGGGVEIFAGPVGLRAEVGDLMYFDRGANHNLRFTFGPQFRF